MARATRLFPDSPRLLRLLAPPGVFFVYPLLKVSGLGHHYDEVRIGHI
jgi:hypothetical protein